MTQAINWHWIFFLNVPIGAATAILARRLISSDRGTGFAAGADVPGAGLITAALMLGVYTIVKPAAELGWTAARTEELMAGAVLLLVGFVAREATASSPLMPLRIFRSRNVVGANLIQVSGGAGMFGVFFLGALYLQRVLGYDALHIGLAFLPVTVIMGTLSVRYSERSIMRFGARPVCVAGLLLLVAGLVLFSRSPVNAGYVEQLLPAMVLLGSGAGLCFPAVMGLAMSGATLADAGLASGLVNTTGQAGDALGLAVMATLSAARSQRLLAAGHPTATALTSGYHVAFWLAAGLVLGAVVVALTVLESPATHCDLSVAPAQVPAGVS